MEKATEEVGRGKRLPRSFFTHSDVVQISKDLLGKFLCTSFDGQLSAGLIVETEAYRAPDDQACHAANNRRTPRTETMFAEGGHAYVYLCYGIHHMFNVVTGPSEIAHAILIRAIEPVDNIPLMLKRRNFESLKTQLCAGPGVLTKALGIKTSHDGFDLVKPDAQIWIEDRQFDLEPELIEARTRVGIAYAGADAYRPWRFSIKENKWVSKGKGL